MMDSNSTPTEITPEIIMMMINDNDLWFIRAVTAISAVHAQIVRTPEFGKKEKVELGSYAKLVLVNTSTEPFKTIMPGTPDIGNIVLGWSGYDYPLAKKAEKLIIKHGTAAITTYAKLFKQLRTRMPRYCVQLHAIAKTNHLIDEKIFESIRMINQSSRKNTWQNAR